MRGFYEKGPKPAKKAKKTVKAKKPAGFKVGDRVKCVNPGDILNFLKKGQEYTVKSIDRGIEPLDSRFVLLRVGGQSAGFAHRFVKVAKPAKKGSK